MIFLYTAKKISGEETKGSLEARDRFELARNLRTNGFILTEWKEGSGQKKTVFNINISFLNKVSLSDKMIFSKNLSVMVSAGMPVVRGIETLAHETSNKNFQKILKEVADNIKRGKSLSESLENHKNIFSPLFIAMVKVGEEGGKLAESLLLVGSQLERDNTLRRRIKGALMYPLIIVIAMIGIGALMMIYVVPTLVGTFTELGVELPTSTKLIIFISNSLTHNPIISLLAVFILGGSIFWFLRTEKGKRTLVEIMLRIPVLSPLVKKINSARTARALSSLIDSGVNLIEGLTITKNVLQNYRYRAVLEEAINRIQKGGTLSETFLLYGNLYPSLVGEMISAGEETGKLGEMLKRLADFYEEEVSDSTKDLSSIIEPVILIFIGLAVGIFTISMIKPLYSVLDTIQ